MRKIQNIFIIIVSLLLSQSLFAMDWSHKCTVQKVCVKDVINLDRDNEFTNECLRGAELRKPFAEYRSYFKILDNKKAKILRPYIGYIELNNLTKGAIYSTSYNGYRISFVLGGYSEYYEFQIEKILTVDNSLLLIHHETGYCELIDN